VRELGEDNLFAQEMASSYVLWAQTLASNSDLCICFFYFFMYWHGNFHDWSGVYRRSPVIRRPWIFATSCGIVQCTVIFFQSFSLNFFNWR